MNRFTLNATDVDSDYEEQRVFLTTSLYRSTVLALQSSSSNSQHTSDCTICPETWGCHLQFTVHPLTGHEDTEGQYRFGLELSLTL
jgi:hypothetical protein